MKKKEVLFLEFMDKNRKNEPKKQNLPFSFFGFKVLLNGLFILRRCICWDSFKVCGT